MTTAAESDKPVTAEEGPSGPPQRYYAAEEAICSMTESDIERFWSKVMPPDENGCMLWRASLQEHGYGQFSIRGLMVRANRVSLFIKTDQCPTHLEAAHSCGNRHCVAPAHLRWATKSENESDKIISGTSNSGEGNGMAKLTAKQVSEIRARYAMGHITQQDIANRYGVSRRAIGRIVNNKAWVAISDDGRDEICTTCSGHVGLCKHGKKTYSENDWV